MLVCSIRVTQPNTKFKASGFTQNIKQFSYLVNSIVWFITLINPCLPTNQLTALLDNGKYCVKPDKIDLQFTVTANITLNSTASTYQIYKSFYFGFENLWQWKMTDYSHAFDIVNFVWPYCKLWWISTLHGIIHAVTVQP